MQNSAPAIPRLGIPAYDWWNEALHGVARAGEATVFPQAIGMAATWDTGLMHRIADVISTEARAKYNEAIRNDDHSRYHGLTFWSPNINIFRDPRWGRGQETYGEDPYLTGRMAVAFIQGMQGNDPHYFKVIATAKHYAVHSGPESTRHQFDAHPSERDLERDLSAGLPRRYRRGQSRLHDVRVQPRGRRARLRQHRSSREASARRLGFPGLRGQRLRRHQRHLPRTPLQAQCRRGLRRRRQGRHRPHLRQRVPRPGRAPSSRASSKKARSTVRSSACSSLASSWGCSIRRSACRSRRSRIR